MNQLAPNFFVISESKTEVCPRILFEQVCDKYHPRLSKRERIALWELGNTTVETAETYEELDFSAQLARLLYFEKKQNGRKYFSPIMSNTSNYVDGSERLVKEPSIAASSILRIHPETGVHFSFLQIAIRFLYDTSRYICLGKKLYKWEDNHYRFCSNLQEHTRIKQFASLYLKQVEHQKRPPKSKIIRDVLSMAKMRYGVDPNIKTYPGIHCANGVIELAWKARTPYIDFVGYDPTKHYFFTSPGVVFHAKASPKKLEDLFDLKDSQERGVFLQLIASSLQRKDRERARKRYSQ